MSIEDCLGKVKRFVKDSGLEKEINGERIENLASQMHEAGYSGGTYTKAQFYSKVQDFIDVGNAHNQAMIRTANAMNKVREESLFRELTTNYKGYKAQIEKGLKVSKTMNFFGHLNSPERMALEASRVMIQGGGIRPGINTKLDPLDASKSIETMLMNRVHTALDMGNAHLDSKIPQNLHDFHMETSAITDGTRRGLTKNKAAEEMAKVLVDFEAKAFQMKQPNNPFLQELKGRVSQNSWRQEVFARGKREDFVADMMAGAAKGSFKGLPRSEVAKAFGEMYDDVKAGIRKSSNFDDDDFDSHGNIMKRQAAHRVVHFDTPKTRADILTKWGEPTPYEHIAAQARRASYEIATLSRLGPTPDQMLDRVFNRFGRSLPKAEQEQYRQDRIKYLTPQWEAIKGSQNSAPILWEAKVVQGLMTIERAVKGVGGFFHAGAGHLGMASGITTAFTDSPLLPNVAKIASKSLSAFAANSKEREIMGRKQGLFLNTVIKTLYQNSFGEPGELGALTKYSNAIGTWSLGNRLNESAQYGHAAVETSLLGDVARKQFSSLPKGQQESMLGYGIDSKWWDVLRAGVSEVDGHKHVLPSGVQALPDAALDPVLKALGKEPTKLNYAWARDTAEQKLMAAINEMTQRATGHLNTRNRFAALGNTDINSFDGAVRRMVGEFKGWMFTQADTMKANSLSSGAAGSSNWGVAKLMAVLAVLYYAAQATKDFVTEGKTPAMTLEAGAQALANSIGGPYVSQLVNMVRHSQDSTSAGFGLAKAAMGPVLADGFTLAGNIHQDMQPGTRHRTNTLGQVGNTLAGATGVGSFVYSKFLFDYLIKNQFKSDSQLSKMEKNAKSDGQSYLVGPAYGRR